MADQTPQAPAQGQTQPHRPQNMREAYQQTQALHSTIFSDANLNAARAHYTRVVSATPALQSVPYGALGALHGANGHFARETVRSIAKFQAFAGRALTDTEVAAVAHGHHEGTRGYVLGETGIDVVVFAGMASGRWPVPKAMLGDFSPKVVNSSLLRVLAWAMPVRLLLGPISSSFERVFLGWAQGERESELRQLSDDITANAKAGRVFQAPTQQPQQQRSTQPQGSYPDSTAGWGNATLSSSQQDDQSASPQASATTYKAPWFSSRGSPGQSQQSQSSYDASPTNETWEPAAAPTNRNWENEASSSSSSSSTWDEPLFDDGASPVAPQSRVRNTGSSSSNQSTSWAQLRAQALGKPTPSATQSGGPFWGNNSNNSNDSNAQGQSGGYVEDNSWGAGTEDGQSRWERERSQREFDAMIERERGGDQSASGKILR